MLKMTINLKNKFYVDKKNTRYHDRILSNEKKSYNLNNPY